MLPVGFFLAIIDLQLSFNFFTIKSCSIKPINITMHLLSVL